MFNLFIHICDILFSNGRLYDELGPSYTVFGAPLITMRLAYIVSLTC